MKSPLDKTARASLYLLLISVLVMAFVFTLYLETCRRAEFLREGVRIRSTIHLQRLNILDRQNARKKAATKAYQEMTAMLVSNDCSAGRQCSLCESSR